MMLSHNSDLGNGLCASGIEYDVVCECFGFWGELVGEVTIIQWGNTKPKAIECLYPRFWDFLCSYSAEDLDIGEGPDMDIFFSEVKL